MRVAAILGPPCFGNLQTLVCLFLFRMLRFLIMSCSNSGNTRNNRKNSKHIVRIVVNLYSKDTITLK